MNEVGNLLARRRVENDSLLKIQKGRKEGAKEKDESE